MKNILLASASTLLFSGLSLAQLPVSTATENKNAVLEEYTGIYCTYCPDGHKIAQDLKDANPNDVILVNIHTGSYANPSGGDPDFRTSFGSALASQSDLTGYPAGSINRRTFSGMSMASGSAMSRSNWVSAANTVMGETSYVNVAGEATLDVTTRVLTVNIEWYYTGSSPASTNKLNVALLQNNVEGPQTGADSFYPQNILPNGNYNHQHMLRHFLTGQWGDDITTTTMGTSGSTTLTYTIPADLNGVEYNLGNLEVVAYIAEGQEDIISGAGVPLTLTNFPYQNDGNLVAAAAIEDLCAGASETISPEITVTNEGEQDITSMVISATVNGGTAVTTNWTGNIPYAQVEYITLDPITFNVLANNDLDVEIISVNGNTDEVAANNTITESFAQAPTTGNIVKVIAETDYYAGETSWEIVDDNSTVIASHQYQAGTDDQWGGGGPDANTTHEHTVDLGAAGCYTLIVYDDYGDGMIYNAGGGSTGSTYGITLQDASSNVVIDVAGTSFSDERSDNFQSDGSTQGASVEEIVADNVSIYPNPTEGLTNVAFTLNTESNVTVQVTNTLGQTVLTRDLGQVSGTQKVQLDGSAFEAGVYIVNITINGESSNYRLTIK